jgi:hypothetical protein
MLILLLVSMIFAAFVEDTSLTVACGIFAIIYRMDIGKDSHIF